MSQIGHNSGGAADLEYANPGNWIALSRDVREHPIVGAGQPVKPHDPSRGAWSRMEAWIDLCCLAQWKPSRINNKGEVMTLDVGQLMGARDFLAPRWNWSEKTVRGYLDRLEAEGMISRGRQVEPEKGQQKGQQRANKCTIITIENYSRYQILSDQITAALRQMKGPAAGQQGASEGPAKGHNLTSKHLNKDLPPTPKGGDAIDEAFEEFWKAFPGDAPPKGRKTDKPKALDVFRRIATGKHRKGLRAPAEQIVAAARQYAATKPDPEFIPMPRTWLNGGRWLDVVEAAPSEVWWRNPERLAEMTIERWHSGITKFANGIWPVAQLGPPPGHEQCVVPRDVVDELKLTERYTPGGLSRDKH